MQVEQFLHRGALEAQSSDKLSEHRLGLKRSELLPDAVTRAGGERDVVVRVALRSSLRQKVVRVVGERIREGRPD